jgi:hypothetical protein
VRRALPDPADLVFVWWSALIALGLSWGLLNKDGDFPRHLAAGEWMLDHRALLHDYPFSWLKAGERFVPFEWLSEIWLAAIYRAGGIPAVVICSGLIIALTYALLTSFLQRRGVRPSHAVLTSLLAALLGILFWRARPHLFTLLGIVVLLHLLERPPGGRRWVYLPLFAVWANLHGGFVYGWLLLAAYLAGAAVTAVLEDAPDARARVREYAWGLGLAVAGALLNPQGPALLTHVLGFLGQQDVVDRTNEFLSPDFHLRHNQIFLLTLLGIIGALAAGSRRLEWARLFAVLLATAFALYSVRNIQLFGVVALPLLALHFSGRRPTDAVAVRPPHAGAGYAVGGVAMAALLATGGRIGGVQVVPDRVDPEVFPVAAVERARDCCPSGRLFNRLNWGGYIAHAWPGRQIFIDGATDFFGDSLFRDYIQLSDVQPGWRDLLARYDISLVIVPSGSALANELARDPAWQVRYRDSTAAVLQREAGSR